MLICNTHSLITFHSFPKCYVRHQLNSILPQNISSIFTYPHTSPKCKLHLYFNLHSSPNITSSIIRTYITITKHPPNGLNRHATVIILLLIRLILLLPPRWRSRPTSTAATSSGDVVSWKTSSAASPSSVRCSRRRLGRTSPRSCTASTSPWNHPSRHASRRKLSRPAWTMVWILVYTCLYIYIYIFLMFFARFSS